MLNANAAELSVAAGLQVLHGCWVIQTALTLTGGLQRLGVALCTSF